jgi:PKD repeat protein
MKSNFLKIFMIALLPVFVASCVDNVPEEEVLPRDAVSFDYRIDGDYSLDYYIDSEVTFINTSPTEGEATWDFGDGQTAQGDTVKHPFDVAGTYNVKLTINGLSKSNVLMISDIKPLVSLNPIEGGLCEVLTTPVSFSLEVPNPKNRKLEYKWIFPERTQNEAGEPYETSTDRLPGNVTFGNVGSQTVRLQVTMDGRLLEEGVLNVPVAYNKEVPTLYYAEQGGHLMAIKLISDAPEGMKIEPFDLGLASGQHPFTLLFKDSSLYVLDAGAAWYFQPDEVQPTGGDGKISVIAKDGSKVETMISNAGGPAFQDPFYGCIVDNDLYFADRNTGVIKVPLNTRNAVYSASSFPYFVQHTTLGYYGKGITYGCIGGTLMMIGDTWWWCKNYNGNGIFRFKKSDILPSAIAAGGAAAPESGVALEGMNPKSLAYSSKSNKYIFTLFDTGYEGVYVCTLDQLNGIGASKNALAPYKKMFGTLGFVPNKSGKPAAVEGHTSEFAAICQIAYDEVNDCAYFAFRNNHNDAASAPTGIYRYNFATDKIEQVLTGTNIYGMVVNNIPAKLF